MACVYFHINPLKNEVFYVGIGKNESRAYYKYRRNNLWNKITNKYGYIVDVIHKDISIEKAKEYEILYIKKLGRLNLKMGKLANLTNGGDGGNGSIQSKESKLKRSLKLKGIKKSEEWKLQMSKKMTGKKRSDELKIKLSNHFKENPSTPRKAVDLLDMEGNFIKSFKSIKEASKVTGINNSAISRCCNLIPRYKSVHKTKWRFSPIK